MSGTGHLMAIEKPGEFNQILTTFLQRGRSR